MVGGQVRLRWYATCELSLAPIGYPSAVAGGRGKSGRKQKAEAAPGLTVPENTEMLLRPNHRPTAFPKSMELSIIEAIREFEHKFGIGILTPVLISSLATEEVLSQLPPISNGVDFHK